MSYVAKDFARSKLAAGITAGDVSFTASAGEGDRFPTIVYPDYTYLVFQDAAGNAEIVKATLRNPASDVVTIERAQFTTAARSWPADTVVECRPVAYLVETAMAHATKTADAHEASAISAVPVGNLIGDTVAEQLAELESEKEPSFEYLGLSKGGTGATSRAGALQNLGIEKAEIAITTAEDATTDIGAAVGQDILLTTTATTITGFAAAAAGVRRKVRVSTGGFVMVNSATFPLPGGQNITPAAGDQFETVSFGSGWRVRNYLRADGKAVVAPAMASQAEMEAGAESAERGMSPERVNQSSAKQGVQLFPISASVASNALTVTLNPTVIDFRSSSLNSGAINRRNLTSAISLVISAGSTLGTSSGVAATLRVLALDNAGTVELAVCHSALAIDESTLINTTAEGGAGSADSASLIYSATARNNVPFRVIGNMTLTEATAGTWATPPSKIVGEGGWQAPITLPEIPPMTAVVGIVWNGLDTNGTPICRATRANGTTFDFQTAQTVIGGGE